MQEGGSLDEAAETAEGVIKPGWRSDAHRGRGHRQDDCRLAEDAAPSSSPTRRRLNQTVNDRLVYPVPAEA